MPIFNHIFIITLLCFSMSVNGSSKNQLIKENLELSGFNKQISKLSKTVKKGFDEKIKGQELKNAPMATIQYTRKLRDIYLKAYREYNFKGLLTRSAVKHIPQDVLKAVNDWYKSDFGKSIIDEEIDAFRSGKIIEFQRFSQVLELSPPGEYRMQLIERLDSIIGESSTHVLLTQIVDEKVAIGLNMGRPEVLRKPASEVLNELKKTKKLMTNQAIKTSKMMLLFAYRNLTNKEILKYLKFLESKEGRTYYKVMSHLIKYALKDAIKNTDQEVEKIISKPK